MTATIRQAVVLCGGKGTRLGDIARAVPKPLIRVGGKPVLDHIIEVLARGGITQVILAAGHLGHQIADYYHKPSHGCSIKTVIEETPSGTSGALNLLRDELDEDFLLVYGDVFLDCDVAPLLQDHAQHRPMATLLVRESDHPWDSDLIGLDSDSRVVEFVRHRVPARLYRNVANAAVYVLSRGILKFIPTDQPSDFGGDVFPAALAAGTMLRAHWLAWSGMVKDMGTPKRKQEVEDYLDEKAIAANARSRPGTVKTVFVDRDGTLTREDGHLVRADRLDFLPGVPAAVARMTRAGIKIVVITNQPVIARGMCSVEVLEAIHRRLCGEIEAAGGRIDAIYYCPHHPDTHHDEGVAELRRACRCRKPAPGLIFQAMREQQVDLSAAVMVGDRALDVQAGRAAGVRTVLVGPRAQREPQAEICAPDAQFDSLLDFANALLSGGVFSR